MQDEMICEWCGLFFSAAEISGGQIITDRRGTSVVKISGRVHQFSSHKNKGAEANANETGEETPAGDAETTESISDPAQWNEDDTSRGSGEFEEGIFNEGEDE